jgi:hypothetical protein
MVSQLKHVAVASLGIFRWSRAREAIAQKRVVFAAPDILSPEPKLLIEQRIRIPPHIRWQAKHPGWLGSGYLTLIRDELPRSTLHDLTHASIHSSPLRWRWSSSTGSLF